MATKAFPKTLQQAIIYFSDAETCLSAAIGFRWGGGPVTCPTCGSEDVRLIATRRIWRCGTDHAKRQFSVKVGTIMEDSPIALDKWMVAIWLITNAKNGISSYELHRAIGITQKSAWFMLHRIRLILQDENAGGKMSGTVEIDETYIGGKSRPGTMHGRKGQGHTGTRRVSPFANKVAVLGLLERKTGNGASRVKLAVIPNVKKGAIAPLVRERVEPGSNLMTDALRSYRQLADQYTHKFIDHAETYAQDNVHTNGLENFWSLLKRTIRGTYVAIEPFHMFRYLDEQCYRFNHRKLNDAQRFVKAAGSILGKRLTYKTLTGHALPESC